MTTHSKALLESEYLDLLEQTLGFSKDDRATAEKLREDGDLPFLWAFLAQAARINLNRSCCPPFRATAPLRNCEFIDIYTELARSCIQHLSAEQADEFEGEFMRLRDEGEKGSAERYLVDIVRLLVFHWILPQGVATRDIPKDSVANDVPGLIRLAKNLEFQQEFEIEFQQEFEKEKQKEACYRMSAKDLKAYVLETVKQSFQAAEKEAAWRNEKEFSF